MARKSRDKFSLKRIGLAQKLAGMVFILGILIYIPSIIFGAVTNLKIINAELADYKKGVEMRIQNAFEPAIWNYDIETLRKLITLELNNENLESVRISTEETSLIWLSSRYNTIFDETVAPEGKYIEKKVIPVYRMDEKERIIAYATIWYDHSMVKNQYFKKLINDFVIVGALLLTISVAMTITSYIRLVRPLEEIRNSMIEAGKSAMDLAKKKISKARFKRAFPEIRSMGSDLEYMLGKIIKLNNELEDKVAERTHELENANCELEAAIEDLRTAQAQLINTEKMAVLGKLFASIAHELNTPLGIINSAGGSIERILKKELNNVICFCCRAPKELYEIYNELVHKSNDNLDNTQKRMLRRIYSNAAEEKGIKVCDEIIEKLLDLGYEEDADDFIALVEKPANIEAIQAAYSIAILHKSVEMIRVSTEKASTVILALKTYSHKDTSIAPVPYDVVKDVEMVLTLYYNQMKYGVEIVREYEEVSHVICFPDKLHQIWVNIINNALQAMNYKGTLKICISNDHDKVKVSISDNGPGIPEAIIDRIFDPFFTTKKLGEGTGLGLDIVKRIVEEIDGSINVESRSNETTFNVWLKT